MTDTPTHRAPTPEERAAALATASPSRLFIQRPIATSLLMFAILLAGLIGFLFLPLSALPEVDYPTIQVQTFYPGAAPDVMTSYITAPLERQFGEMPGLSRMTSTSSQGASIITLQFDLALSLDVAEQEVQAQINAAGNLLPSDLPTPPVYAKINPADAPVVSIALTSKTMPLNQVQDLADTRLASKLSQLAGVGLVTVAGGQRPAVRVQANPKALAAYGLSLETLRTTIASANVNGAKGSFNGKDRAYTIDANDQLASPDDYANTIIAYSHGAPVHLRDVATVISGTENNQLGALQDLTPAIILNVQRQPGANVIGVVNRIKALLPQTFCAGDSKCLSKTQPGALEQSLPPSVNMAATSDGTVTIRASVSDVEFELTLSVILVVAMIYIFLRNVPATIIAGLSVPLSLIGAFATMYLLGYSLNNLTLMALTIASGFVVDDAIVMIENISRYVEMGYSPKEAAMKGSGEIGFTIISLTVSLLAVLIPLLFMGDVVGRLFREFAVTLAVTIIISAVVSLTMVPSLCGLWLKQPKEPKHNSLSARFERGFEWTIARYDAGLKWVLARQTLTLLVALGTFALTAVLYLAIPKGLFPVQDTGLIQGISQASESISYGAMTEAQRKMAQAILSDPDVDNVSSFVGVDAQNETLNSGRVLITLKPLGVRHASASDIIRRLNRETQGVAGISLYLQPVQDLTLDSSVGRTQYQFLLGSVDQAALGTWTNKLMAQLRQNPKLEDVSSDIQNDGLAAYIQVDRDTAARLGISLATIDNLLYDAFGQRIVSTIFTQSNQYRVILDAGPSVTQSANALDSIYVTTSSGASVPLSAIATIREQSVPLLVTHVGQFPATTVSFNLAQGVSLGESVTLIQQAEKDIGVPASITTSFTGSAEAYRASLGNELWLILAAIVAIYIVLGVLYESFIHPVTILSTLPSAAVGALIGLYLSGQDLGVIGIIGIILLIGIVKKNAIMMIDFALDAERNEGKSAQEAIHQAALLRFRPILMTTLAALLAAVPLWLGGGIGAELRRPLGVSIIGGLICSQLLTLFTTPVIYIAFDNLASRFAKKDPESPARDAPEGEGPHGPHDAPGGAPAGSPRGAPYGPGAAAGVNPSALFIRRPVATVLLTLAIALLGVAAYFVLPVASLPQVDFPTIQVRAQFAGASPNVMAATVATPLEKELSQIADVSEMTSTSSSNGATGQTNITLQFGLDRDINGAARDVQAAINAALALLPANLNSRPSYNKANPADPPIMVLSLTSDTLTTPQVYDQANVIVLQALSQINGVGEVDVGGGASPAIRVEMNPYALNKYGIGLEDVGAALQSTNAFQPKGAYSDGARRLQIYTNDQATQVGDYQNVIVGYRNGGPVRLKDVATIVNGPESVFNLGLANGKQAIILRVTKSPGANIVATVDRINAILPQLRADLPAAIQMKVQLDNTISIRASLAEVERTLFIAIVLVVVVVLLFLRNGRATLIPAVAVTTSLLGTLAIMYLFHYSLDNLSLMALTVATGFVVDDAIVVLENITRHVEDGMPRFQAALVGAQEVGFTVMSMSISLIAVFIPILAMGGIVGRLFREFAVTLSASIFISLIISLTATPMMAARLVDEPMREGDPHARRRGPIRRAFTRMGDGLEWGFDRMLKTYEKSLAWALDNSLFVLIVLIVTVCLTVYLYVVVPKGFFPEEDNGFLVGGVQVDQASSFNLTAAKFHNIQAIVMHDKAVQSVTSFTQSAGGFMFVVLKPKNERPGSSAQQVIFRLTPKLRRIAGAQLFLQAAQDIRVGGRQANAEYQYTLTSDDLDALRTWSNKLLTELQKSPVLTQANTDQLSNALETYITVDHGTASRLGLSAQQVDNTLYDAFGQKFASIIYNPENQYHVVMEVDQKYQGDPNALKAIYVTPAAGSSGAALGGVTSTASTTAASTSGSGGSSASSASVLSSTTASTPAAATLSSSTTTASSSSTASAVNGALQAAGSSGGSTRSGTTGASSQPSVSAASVSSLTATPTVANPTNAGGAGAGATGATGSSLDIAEVGSTSAGGTSASSANAGATQGGAGSLGGAGVQRSTTGGAVAASTGVAISTSAETMIPLSAIATWALQNTPLQVNHQGTSAAATLSFNLAPGKSLSDAQKAVAQASAAIGMPSTVVGSFQGTAKVFQQSLSNEPLLIAAALMAVYVVLGVLYESYIHPLTVLSTIPSAGVGAVLAMMLFGIDFSIISLIGVILLIGIVKKNAIMIIDFALVAEREQGLSSRDAIYQACVLRFRPILMTTCAAIMGAVPLALGLGQGGELRQPLGIAIIGGLIASQLLTLLTTPVVYLYLDRLHNGRERRLPRGLRGAGDPSLVPAE